MTLRIVSALVALTFVGSAIGQEISAGNAGGPPGGTAEVSVDWTGDGTVDNITVWFDFDETVITPQVSGANNDVVGCLDGVPSSHTGILTTCRNPTATPGRIVLVISNQSGGSVTSLPTTNIGSFTFDIAGGATAPSTETVTVDVQEATDSSLTDVTASVSESNGEVSVQDVTAVLNVQPPSISFGNQEVSTTSSAQQVTISNDGTDGIDMQVSDVSLATGTDYILANGTCGTTPFTLADGASCTVDVSFNPQSIANNITDTLNVTSDAGSVTNDAVALEGNGVAGPGATLDLTPASFDFGDELTGSGSSTTTFTVTNNGDSGSNLSIDTIAISGGDFTVSGGSCSAGTTELGAGASCTIEVEFAPAADGAQSETLSVDGTDTVNSTSLSDSASLDGEGVTQPILSSTPAPGAVNIGTAVIGGSVSRTVTLANDGNAPLDVTCGSPTGDPEITITPDPANFTGIAGGASDSFEVQCDTPEQATYTATLACTSNDPDNPEFTYEFSCTGRPLVVPTMQPWGLAALALLMLIVGGFSIRFFRT
jgi:hypothetical protein